MTSTRLQMSRKIHDVTLVQPLLRNAAPGMTLLESFVRSFKRQIEEDDEINGGDAVEHIVGVYKVVGAIGVSGGTGEQDQAVAEAGAAAFK